MEKLKCDLCGYEYERGNIVCQGCHGVIYYGAGGFKWLLGLVYVIVSWFILKPIDSYLFDLNNAVAFTALLTAFIIGAIHCAFLLRNRTFTIKKELR